MNKSEFRVIKIYLLTALIIISLFVPLTISVSADEMLHITDPRIDDSGVVVESGGKLQRLNSVNFEVRLFTRELFSRGMGRRLSDVEFEWVILSEAGEEIDSGVVVSEEHEDGSYAIFNSYVDYIGSYELLVSADYEDYNSFSVFDLDISSELDYRKPSLNSMIFVTSDSMINRGDDVSVFVDASHVNFAEGEFFIEGFDLYGRFSILDDDFMSAEFTVPGDYENDTFEFFMSVNGEGGVGFEVIEEVVIGDRVVENEMLSVYREDSPYVIGYMDNFTEISSFIDDNILNIALDYDKEDLVVDLSNFDLMNYESWYSVKGRDGIRCIISGLDYTRVTYVLDSGGGELTKTPFSDVSISDYNNWGSMFGYFAGFEKLSYDDVYEDVSDDTYLIREDGVDYNQIEVFYS